MSAFDVLKAKLAQRPGVSSPGGLAAYIGREKAAKAGQPGAFNQAAKQGVSMASVLKKRRKRAG